MQNSVMIPLRKTQNAPGLETKAFGFSFGMANKSENAGLACRLGSRNCIVPEIPDLGILPYF